MIGGRLLRLRYEGIAAALLLACGLAAAQSAGEPALTKRATELRESPSDTGKSVAALPAQAPLTRLEQRQGPWIQVRTAAGATGWLHLFDIAPTTGAQAPQGSQGPSSGGFMRGVTSMFARPAPVQTATSTIGIRGLGAEDLANAQPNLQAVSQVEAQRQTESQARDFAGRAQLKSESVEPLPAPARRAGAANPPGTPQ